MRRMTTGIVSAAVAIVLLVAAALSFGVNGEHDSSGYIASGTTAHATTGYALVSEDERLGRFGEIAVPAAVLGDIRVQVHSNDRVFVGIAHAADVERYLAGVARTEFDLLDDEHPSDHPAAGGRPAGAPASQAFWAASNTGAGTRTLTWKAHAGEWRLVVMAPDGSAHVEAGVRVGASLPHLADLGFALIAGALVLGGLATLLIRSGGRRAHV
jgi:hypothetical protein